jgi:hypothetical protein
MYAMLIGNRISFELNGDIARRWRILLAVGVFNYLFVLHCLADFGLIEAALSV